MIRSHLQPTWDLTVTRAFRLNYWRIINGRKGKEDDKGIMNVMKIDGEMKFRT